MIAVENAIINFSLVMMAIGAIVFILPSFKKILCTRMFGLDFSKIDDEESLYLDISIRVMATLLILVFIGIAVVTNIWKTNTERYYTNLPRTLVTKDNIVKFNGLVKAEYADLVLYKTTKDTYILWNPILEKYWVFKDKKSVVFPDGLKKEPLITLYKVAFGENIKFDPQVVTTIQ